MDQAIQRLLDKQAIAEVVYLRARAADRGDIALAHTCYHPEATERHGKFVGTAADFIDMASTFSPKQRVRALGMLHLITNLVCEFEDADHAFVESCYFAYCQLADGVDAEIGGRYLDRFERRDGRWAIVHRDCVFDWSRMEPQTVRFWGGVGSPPFLFGARDESDPLYLYTRRGV